MSFETSSDDRDLQSWREATDVPEAAVADLRARVLASVAKPRPTWPRWPIAAATVAATILIAWTAWPEPKQVQPAKPALQAPRAVAPVAAPIEDLTPAPPHKPKQAPLVTTNFRKRPRSSEATAQAPRPEPPGAAWIRFETEDPNVVILLVSDGGGE